MVGAQPCPLVRVACVKGVVRAFGWNGPAGVSITRAVARLLGSHEVERVLDVQHPELELHVHDVLRGCLFLF